MSQREWLDRDFYKELGISEKASDDEIKKAYRKLARKLHPDANPGDAKAEEKFKVVTEAHAVLADPQKRKEYDELKRLSKMGAGFGGRTSGAGTSNSGGAGGANFNFEDIFGNAGGQEGGFGDILGGIFGQSSRGSRGSRSTRAPKRQPTRGSDIESSISLSFKDAVLGTTVTLSLTDLWTCQSCNGSGSADGKVTKCPECSGAGYQNVSQGAFAFTEQCRRCNGEGTIIEHPCKECRGNGAVKRPHTVTVRIAPGTNDGAKLRITGQGQAGYRGAPAGDLYVKVKVLPDPIFTRKGDDLQLTLPVSYPELVIGTTIAVPTLEGAKVTMKIPAGTTEDQTLRIKGRGVPKKSSSFGDLLVNFKVVFPKNTNEDSKEMLKKYAETESENGFNPRANWKAGF